MVTFDSDEKRKGLSTSLFKYDLFKSIVATRILSGVRFLSA